MAQAEHPAAAPASGGAGFIQTALPDVAGWLRAFEQREIPVLAVTSEVLEDLRSIEDQVDAHLLAETVSPDPLMTLKLLRHVAAVRQGRGHTDAETATEALVMLGITPFFRDFGAQLTVEQALAGHDEALTGLRQVLHRARRAAHFALGFAIHRRDHDAALIHEAALLHDFAEMLLWCHAPALALALQNRLRARPSLRSSEAQGQLLNIELGELQQALMKTWRLPQLLVQISDDRASHLDQVRNVQLAIRIARHSSQGWDNPALPDDVDEVSALLNLGSVPTMRLLRDLDQ